jgi:hypothetical protein
VAVPGHSSPFLTLLQIRLVACQLGQMASDGAFSPEYRAAYNSAIDLSPREVSDRFPTQQIERSPGDFQGRSTFQPPPLERMEAPLDGHATSTSAPEAGESTLTPEDLVVLASTLESKFTPE